MDKKVIVNEPMLLEGKHRTIGEPVGPIFISERIRKLAEKGALTIISPKPVRISRKSKKSKKKGGKNAGNYGKLYTNTGKG